jgi:hypothetical protein
MRKYVIVVSVFMLTMALPSFAQKFSLSTNLIDYACLGTMNLDASYSLSRRWSLVAGARYNPFTFNEGDQDAQFQYRQQSYSLGARMWPWHTMSGWWFAGKVRYQEYCYGGILSKEAEEGDRFGAGIYAGYTHMLTKHFNVEFGVGVWSGMAVYRRYSCPVCGVTVGAGRKVFLLPDDLMISFAYVF